MPERLTEWLSRKGLLVSDRANAAFERQVRYGGALDTSLLELRLVSEKDLLEALGQAYGLPTASVVEATSPMDPRATRAFPEPWAKRHTLAPLSFDAERNLLSVLTPAPPDVATLTRLGELLELTLQPLIALEFRVYQRLSLLYDASLPDRFKSLIEAEKPNSTKNVNITQVVQEPIVNRPSLTFPEAMARLREARDRDDIIRILLSFAHQELEFVCAFVVHPSKLSVFSAVGEESDRFDGEILQLNEESQSPFGQLLHSPGHFLGPFPETGKLGSLFDQKGRRRPKCILLVPIRIKNRLVVVLLGDKGQRAIPERLAQDLMLFSTHVEQALESLLLRRKVSSLPAPKETADLGKPPFAPSHPEPILSTLPTLPPTQFSTLLPEPAEATAVTLPPPFEEVIPPLQSPALPNDFSLARSELASDEEVPILLTELSRSKRPTSVDFVTEDEAPVLLTHPIPTPLPEFIDEAVSEPPLSADSSIDSAVDNTIDETPMELDRIDEQTAVNDVRTLIQILSEDDRERQMNAAQQLASRGIAILPELMENFPGRVTIDPFALGVELPALSTCGPLLWILDQIGAPAHDYVITKIDNKERIQRFFATYFYGWVFVPDAIPKLIQRLHDEEPRICVLAVRTLFWYRERSEFHLVIDHIHGRLESTSGAARRHAAYLSGLFRDVSAIPQLVEILDKNDRSVRAAAEQALAEITKQQLGSNVRKWKSWWNKNRAKSRMAWLIEGLDSKDSAIRQSSADELAAITGMDFHYRDVAPKRDREEAKKKWVQWWKGQESLQDDQDLTHRLQDL